MRECDNCGGAETRTFTDSWTGAEFCLTCLTTEPETQQDNPLWHLTMSPEDGDNIEQIFPGLKREVEA